MGLHSLLEVYYNEEYGNYVVPAAFHMPESSLILDRSGMSPRINMKEWLRLELHEVKDWIDQMPGISSFTQNDYRILFNSSSLLLVSLKVSLRSAHLEGQLKIADGVYTTLAAFNTIGLGLEMSNNLEYIVRSFDSINIDPLECCLLGAVLFAYPFLPSLEFPESVHVVQENNILNILTYNKHKSRRFNQLCRLVYDLDIVRKRISSSPILMNYLYEWDISTRS